MCYLRIVDHSFSFLFFEKQSEVVVSNFDLFTKTLVSHFKFLVIPRDDVIWTKILSNWEIRKYILNYTIRFRWKLFVVSSIFKTHCLICCTGGLADEIQVCDWSIGNYCAVLSFGNVYHAAQDGSNSSVCEQNPSGTFYHVLQGGGVTRQALKWNHQGKRKKEGPKNTWRRDVQAEMKNWGHTSTTFERLAQNRTRWRKEIVDGPSSRRSKEHN